EIIKYKDKFDFNALNNRNENLILYCSRNRKISSARAIDFLNLLYKYNNNGINFENDNGKTAAMYLAEGFRYRELYYFVKKFKVDPNFKSKLGNTLTSVFIKKYYQIYMNRIIEKEGFCLNNQLFKKAIATLDCLCNIGCDVNVPIDEDGTTMLMICSKLHDDVSYKHLVSKGAKEIELVVQNNGVDYSDSHVRDNIKMSQKWMKTLLEDKANPLHEYMSIYNRICEYELNNLPRF
ncbi:hypothetical protein PIROE2DRAFT_5749, partial [Piromyces sp. E2]